MSNPLRSILHLALLAMAFSGPGLQAWAEKPDWAGKGKGDQDVRQTPEKRQDKDHDDGRRTRERATAQMHGTRSPMVELRLSDSDRRLIRDYYGLQIQSGHCPPGLAKKNNGCMPPGQAKKWAIGQPLPAGLRYYPLPSEVLIRLPLPPAGHEFVRVAADILLIAVGTGMVIDAMRDLGL